MTSQKAKFNALNLNDLRVCLTWMRANLSRKDRKGISGRMFSVIICSILSITEPQLYDFTSVSGAKKAHVPPPPFKPREDHGPSHMTTVTCLRCWDSRRRTDRQTSVARECQWDLQHLDSDKETVQGQSY